MNRYDGWHDSGEPSWMIEPTTEWLPQFPGQRYPGDIGIQQLPPRRSHGFATATGRAEVVPLVPMDGTVRGRRDWTDHDQLPGSSDPLGWHHGRGGEPYGQPTREPYGESSWEHRWHREDDPVRPWSTDGPPARDRSRPPARWAVPREREHRPVDPTRHDRHRATAWDDEVPYEDTPGRRAPEVEPGWLPEPEEERATGDQWRTAAQRPDRRHQGDGWSVRPGPGPGPAGHQQDRPPPAADDHHRSSRSPLPWPPEGDPPPVRPYQRWSVPPDEPVASPPQAWPPLPPLSPRQWPPDVDRPAAPDPHPKWTTPQDESATTAPLPPWPGEAATIEPADTPAAEAPVAPSEPGGPERGPLVAGPAVPSVAPLRLEFLPTPSPAQPGMAEGQDSEGPTAPDAPTDRATTPEAPDHQAHDDTASHDAATAHAEPVDSATDDAETADGETADAATLDEAPAEESVGPPPPGEDDRPGPVEVGADPAPDEEPRGSSAAPTDEPLPQPVDEPAPQTADEPGVTPKAAPPQEPVPGPLAAAGGADAWFRPKQPAPPPARATAAAHVDPEEYLAGYHWRLHPETLRELVDAPDEFREVRRRLTERLDTTIDNRSRARLLSLRAVTARLLGELDAALADARLALTYAESASGLRGTAIVRARLARVLHWRGEFTEADKLLAETDSPELPDRLRASLYEHLGRSCLEQGRRIEACGHFERALDLHGHRDRGLVARTEIALDAVRAHAARSGFGPYPRTREELLQTRRPPLPGPADDGSRWGYADGDGEWVVPAEYAEVQPFREGVAWVRRPDVEGWELIDESGTTLIAASYLAVRSFSDGLAWVSRDGAGDWLAIDTADRIAVPAGFDDVRPFRRAVAAVRRDGGWGAVDRTGRMVVPPRYDGFTTALADGRYVDGFTDEGLAVVDLGGRRGVLDRTGRVVVAPGHTAVVVHPVAFLVRDGAGRWGALDRRGEPLIPPTHGSRARIVAEVDRLPTDPDPVL